MKVIISMTTVPQRKSYLSENITSIVDQSFRFDKLIINVDEKLPLDDKEFYKGFMKLDDRIEVCFVDEKWRSCNKLLPTLRKYPDDIIITVDDDVYYPKNCIKLLIEKNQFFPKNIISHVVQSVIVNKDLKRVDYTLFPDPKMEQLCYGKYLSDCTLFPPHCFDGTDVFDYDKMMYCTNGTHDELWFWVNSTLNGIRCIGLNYVRSFWAESKRVRLPGEYSLSSTNNKPETIQEYNNRIYNLYGSKIYSIVTKDLPEFYITQENIILFLYMAEHIHNIYNYGIKFHLSNNITKAFKIEARSVIDKLF